MEIVSAYQNHRSAGSVSGSASSASSNVPGQSTPSKQLSSGQNASILPDAGQRLQSALSKLDMPELSDANARIELSFNQDTGRVIAKVTDMSNGEVLREIPSKELQHLFSQIREYLGSIVDEEI